MPDSTTTTTGPTGPTNATGPSGPTSAERASGVTLPSGVTAASPQARQAAGITGAAVDAGGTAIPYAEEQGGRVWNHWDDEVAAKLQADAAAEQAAKLGIEPAVDLRTESDLERAEREDQELALTSGRTRTVENAKNR